MLTSERIQRFLMAIMLGVVWWLYYVGSNTFASIILGFMIFMILFWAITNFCPPLWIFSNLFDKKT